MEKKSNARDHGVAFNTAAASLPAGGASTSNASALVPPLHGSSRFSVSASASAPNSAIQTSVPASIHNIASLGTSSLSSSSSRSAAGSPAFQLRPRRSRLAIDEIEPPVVAKHILDLLDTELRGNALKELAKKMVAFPDMAPSLWFSFGTIAILLQEVLSIYMMMSQSSITPEQSSRACDVLALFQCVAIHSSTQKIFVEARIPVYLCSFLGKNGEFKAFEHVRIATLGVIGALVKEPDTDVITFLLSLEIMPICLRAMENGTDMSRTVATFILQRLLQNNVGLQYICQLPIRAFAVLQALGNVVASLSEKLSVRLLRLVVKCYQHFLNDQRTLQALKIYFPKKLSDGTFEHCVREDQALRGCLQQVLDKVQGTPVSREPGGLLSARSFTLCIFVGTSILRVVFGKDTTRHWATVINRWSLLYQ